MDKKGGYKYTMNNIVLDLGDVNGGNVDKKQCESMDIGQKNVL